MTSRERILFVTSNGTGLGHLTRSMAIARRLDSELEPLFFTLSEAASVVREVGFPVEYVASHGSPGAGTDWRWSRRLGPRLQAAIAEAAPRALVFDGILPYDPLLAAMRPVPLTIWCRRGLWRPGASAVPLTRAGRFDAVLEPGEFAAGEDRGPTARRRRKVHEVAPIVFCDDEELLPRAEAERELGLEPGMTTVLVQLGQGAEVARAQDRCLRALAGREGVQVAAMSSAIAGLVRRSRGDRASARDLSDQPLLRGLRRRRLRRRLQRLPRADPLPGSERLRADAARNRRSGGAGALRGPQRCRGGR